jgi:hypothetical protein
LAPSTPFRHIDGVEVWLLFFLSSTRDRDDWETREVVVNIDPTQGLVLRPTCVPEKEGMNRKMIIPSGKRKGLKWK